VSPSPTVVITGPDLKPLTDPITGVLGVDVTLKDNDVGSGSFTAPAYPRLLSAIAPGNRVRVDRLGQTFISGPIEKPGAYSWSASDPSTAGPGTVTVSFADNLVYLAWRLTYPDPTQPSTAQTAAEFWTVAATNAETVMRNLVNLNAGPGALVARRIPGLVLGTVAGVGSNINISTRFQPITEVLRTAALAGGTLQFRIVENSARQLVFNVAARRDLSHGPGAVRFSRSLGNLVALATDPDAPTATVAVVGGEGSGATRIVVERSTAAAATWGRIETFVNQSGVSDTTGLQMYGDAALLDAAEKVGLTATAIDEPGAAFGVNYQLGDLVGVDLATGAQFVAAVQSLSYKWTPDGGEVISPTIGGTDPHTDTPTVKAVRDMLRRLARLEAS
jgi:hypothetical protein